MGTTADGTHLQGPPKSNQPDDREVSAVGQIARLAREIRPKREHEEDWAFFREALPEYDVKERIHYGGQGVVYRALHRVAKRAVAIKVLLDGPLASERQRQRLTREMELVARLRHPNIVTLYEAGEVRGRPFLVMEYIDGLAIDDYVLVNDLSVRRIVETFKQVCEAVGSAHERGVIHRDIKPPNILVDANGKPSVLDFGLARDTGADSNEGPMISLTGQIVGTLPYLSPEQAGGKNREVDIRSDIYALGVVLFELITGSYPYPIDGSPEEVRANIMAREPMRLRKALGKNTCDRPGALRDVNDDLDRIVLKALSKEKERRYNSAASFADDLDRYLNGQAVEAKAASSLYVLRKSLRRFRLQIVAGFCVLLVIVGAGIWVGAERIRTRAVAQAYTKGLQMGGLVKLGSVRADEGQYTQAIALLESVLEIADAVPVDDPVALRYRHEALEELAALHLQMGNWQTAGGYVDAALELCERVLGDDPNDLEWGRLQGVAYFLRSHVAFALEDWATALQASGRAISLFSGLAATDALNSSLKFELARAFGQHGKILGEMRRSEEAIAAAHSALRIQEELVRLEPDVSAHVIEAIRTEGRIGIIYMHRRTEVDDEQATLWLERAETRLVWLRNSGTSNDQTLDIARMLEAISQNQRIIQKRALKQSRTSN